MSNEASGLGFLPVTPALLMPVLLWVVVEDVLYRRIRNLWVLVLLCLWLGGVSLAVIQGASHRLDLLAEAAWALPGAAAVLSVGIVLFRFGLVGGGDVKLMAALSLWVGAPLQPAFLIATSLAGGVLVALMPLLRPIEYVAANLWWSLACRLPGATGMTLPHSLAGEASPGLPYALAIAVGASFVLFVFRFS